MAQDAPHQKIVLNVGAIEDMVTDNPWKACCTGEYEMMFLNYDMLLTFAQEDLSAAPGLATGCTPSSDSMTWTCSIRSGIRWSDGEPLTSRDVAFTYRFVLENGISLYENYLPFNPTFETPNDQTLIWKAERPTFAPIVPPWIYIVPEHIWSQYEGMTPKEIKSVSNTPSVGSGPFQLAEWRPGQLWRMEANPDYWGGAPAIDEVVFRVFNNQEAMAQAVRSGDIDVAGDLNPSLFLALKDQADIHTAKTLPDWWLNLAFNFGGQGSDATNDPALQDLSVRQAIAHAIDKQAIVDLVYRGFALPGDTVVRPASTAWHLDLPPDQEFAFDPD